MALIRRYGRRGAQRGAAIFVVVMVLTMLTAVGIFAMRASSLSGAASGYQRQATGSQSFGEYGIVATVAELGTQRRAEYIKHVLSGTDKCVAEQSMYSADGGAQVDCYTLYDSDLTENGIGALNDSSADGGASPTVGEFHVEMTDVSPASTPVAGADLGSGRGGKYWQVTLTSFGQERPEGQTGQGAGIAAGNTMGRANIVVGPIQ
jgi:Tfp pilus assembly protein PilX